MRTEPNKGYARIAELAKYEYGYIAKCIPCDRNSEVEQYLKRYKTYVDYLIKCDYKAAEMTTYPSAHYTYRVGISWLRVALMGNKSISLVNCSIRMGKQNATGPIQRGSTQYFTSAFFKGDAEKGTIDYFLRAERVAASQGKSEGSWLYLSLLIQIAECCVGVGEQTQTEVWYHKVISLEPRLTWALNSKYLENKQKHEQQ